MLLLTFQLGKDRYAIEASRVVEVVPLLTLKRLPQAPRGIAGILNYRGQPIPALDLCDLALGTPARDRLSTRIILLNTPDGQGALRLIGLIAEQVTDLVRRDAREFVNHGLETGDTSYLGPVALDSTGSVQLVRTDRLLNEPLRQALFADPATLTA